MLKSLSLLAVFLLASAYAQSQNFIHGVCLNQDKKPIENVGVYCHDSLLMSITDESGAFLIRSAKAGDTVKFVHLSFEPVKRILKQSDFSDKALNITMNYRSNELPSVDIVANAPHVVFDNPVQSVVDFEFNSDGIYLIVWRKLNCCLLHLSYDFDTLHEMKLSPSMKHLYRDKRNYMMIYGDNDRAYQIHCFGSGKPKSNMELINRMTVNKLRNEYASILAASDTLLITGRFFFYNKQMGLYCHDLKGDSLDMLRFIIDEEASDDIELILRTGGLRSLHGISLFTRPIYNPVFCVDNQLYLLSFTEHKTFVYDHAGRFVAEYPLTCHLLKNWNGKLNPDRSWKEKVLVDEARKEFYALFVKDGATILKRIDLEHGTATEAFNLSGYPFAEKIRVHDGKVYFLYPTGTNRRKCLYEVKMN